MSDPAQHRKRRKTGHFTFSRRLNMPDASTSTRKEQPDKGHAHQAQLIPGIDGHRVFGFPNSIITKIRYGTYLTLTASAGARALNVFSANGVFDPDITGVGHQPMWSDNYSNIYNHYTVLGSKITAVFAPVTAALNQLVGIVGDDDSSISTNVQVLLEQNNSVAMLMGVPGSQPVAMTSTFEPLEMFGVETKDDGASSTAVGANPSEQWTYTVWNASADGSSTVVCNVKVEIEYTVKYSELITQGLS